MEVAVGSESCLCAAYYTSRCQTGGSNPTVSATTAANMTCFDSVSLFRSLSSAFLVAECAPPQVRRSHGQRSVGAHREPTRRGPVPRGLADEHRPSSVDIVAGWRIDHRPSLFPSLCAHRGLKNTPLKTCHGSMKGVCEKAQPGDLLFRLGQQGLVCSFVQLCWENGLLLELRRPKQHHLRAHTRPAIIAVTLAQ